MHNMTLDNSHLFTDLTRGEQQLFSTMKVMSWRSHLILPTTRIIHFLLQGMVHHGGVEVAILFQTFHQLPRQEKITKELLNFLLPSSWVSAKNRPDKWKKW